MEQSVYNNGYLKSVIDFGQGSFCIKEYSCIDLTFLNFTFVLVCG